MGGHSVNQAGRRQSNAGRQAVQGRACRSEMLDRQVRDVRQVGMQGGAVRKGRAGRQESRPEYAGRQGRA
jgi:hypothetical protein